MVNISNLIQEGQTILQDPIKLKAKLLCEGFNADDAANILFKQQNPSNVKRGGLSSGGKMKLDRDIFVNAPLYNHHSTDLKVTTRSIEDRIIDLEYFGRIICQAEILPAPDWYNQKINEFDITQIVTAHNRQLAIAVYENCDLFDLPTFKRGIHPCQFCVMNESIQNNDPRLVLKSPELILAALKNISGESYDGISLNGGMMLTEDRGLRPIISVVKAIRKHLGEKPPIAIEITPPTHIKWIDVLAQYENVSLMMNLECWSDFARRKTISGKDKYCPKSQYLRAFEYAVAKLGFGKVSSCFIIGTESDETLKIGIDEIVKRGVIPSPIAGRYFEDVKNYKFRSELDWEYFLSIIYYCQRMLEKNSLFSTDKAGCVACGMCDFDQKNIKFKKEIEESEESMDYKNNQIKQGLYKICEGAGAPEVKIK